MCDILAIILFETNYFKTLITCIIIFDLYSVVELIGEREIFPSRLLMLLNTFNKIIVCQETNMFKLTI